MGLVPSSHVIRMGPPEALVVALAGEFSIDTFVETGTYQGDTAVWAARNFRRVFTIESSRELWAENVRLHGDLPNVEFILGDSRSELGKLTARLEGPHLLWLDAHWCGGSTSGPEDQCPLLGELAAVSGFRGASFIFIDDARLFTSPPEPPNDAEQWPDFPSVLRALDTAERYIVIIEDVIVAVPRAAKEPVARYCREVKTRDWERYHERQRASDSGKRPGVVSRLLERTLAFRKRA